MKEYEKGLTQLLQENDRYLKARRGKCPYAIVRPIYSDWIATDDDDSEVTIENSRIIGDYTLCKLSDRPSGMKPCSLVGGYECDIYNEWLKEEELGENLNN